MSVFPGNLPNEITVYTDGACDPNPGPGGWGAVIIKDGMVIELGGPERATTNNQMELRAALEALNYLAGSGGTIRIRSDSLYVCNACSKWLSKWERNGWRTTSGEPVSNSIIIQKIATLERSIRGQVIWEPVRGHYGIPGNERADEIAEGFVGGQSELHNCSLEDHPYDFSKLMQASKRRKYRGDFRKSDAPTGAMSGFDVEAFLLGE